MEENKILHGDCMKYLPLMQDNSIDFTLTDIPYNGVNRKSNGLRNLNKGNADLLTFDLQKFLPQIYRVTKNSIVIFCGHSLLSEIYSYFSLIEGTVRTIVWEKTNPSPMNGQVVYLSGIELGVWFKKRGSKTFNAHCKNTVFHFPSGRSKLHPTEKNHNLLKDLILDNTNENDIIFDPCAGSGSHLLVAYQLNRKYLGYELDEHYYNIANERLLKETVNGIKS